MKLTYTDEMQKQDKLWETEKEDTNIMLSLYDSIIQEAKQLGFNGIYESSICNGEAVIYIYDNEEEKEQFK